MKVIVKLLFVSVFVSAFMFAKNIEDGSKKAISINSPVSGSVKFTHQYGKSIYSDDTIERKRSHKRRRAVRKPRKGRGH